MILMLNNSFEDRFCDSKRWMKGNECLNMEDINLPPINFYGDKEKWINELTTYIYFYPKEWKMILEEYNTKIQQSGQGSITNLLYYRNDEGYLRKKYEEDIFLRITVKDCYGVESLSKIANLVFRLKEWGFYEYEYYCSLNRCKRNQYLDLLTRDISRQGNFKENNIKILYVSNYDESSFEKKDLFIDPLNHSFVIL